MKQHPPLSWLGGILLLALQAKCPLGDSETELPVVVLPPEVVLTPVTARLEVGQLLPFHAETSYPAGGEAPGFTPRSSTPSVARIFATETGESVAGAIHIKTPHDVFVIGAAAGIATIVATLETDPTAQAASAVIVSESPVTVEVDPAFELMADESRSVSCRARRQRDGEVIPGIFFDWASSDPSVADVVPAPFGETAEVTGREDGVTEVRCSIPGRDPAEASGSVRVTVGTGDGPGEEDPPGDPGAPPAEVIAGNYDAAGVKLTDTCTLFEFPADYDPGRVQVTTMATNGQVQIRINHPDTESALTGPYDPATGEWTGAGVAGLRRDTLTGRWMTDGVLVWLEGTLLYEAFDSAGSKLCEATYEVTYTRL